MDPEWGIIHDLTEAGVCSQAGKRELLGWQVSLDLQLTQCLVLLLLTS